MKLNKHTASITLTLVCVFVTVFRLSEGYAHDQPVHWDMTGNATILSNNLSDFISQNYLLTGATDPLTLRFKYRNLNPSVTGWLQHGAWHEDDYSIFPINGIVYWVRSVNHFYDPIHGGLGLTDASEGPFNAAFGLPRGIVDSFTWATTSPNNTDYDWSAARANELAALTDSSNTSRNSDAAEMFDTIGHVIHLVQDLSQPSHVRNDAHYSTAFIEDYGLAHVGNLTYNPGSAFDWAGAGFNKLLDFWSRGVLNGSTSDATALNNDYEDGGTDTLGLAEFSNGNFLSEKSFYGNVTTSGIHHFSYPSLGTDVTSISKDSTNDVYYLAKTGNGVPVTHHSVFSELGFLSYKNNKPISERDVTIKDDQVLHDYHAIVIPKGVAFSAGILDYFFRGQISCNLATSVLSGEQDVTITNYSESEIKGSGCTLFPRLLDLCRQFD